MKFKQKIIAIVLGILLVAAMTFAFIVANQLDKYGDI
tara:strand:- start:1946 stop:2056 length:111 start_codon:yes stop_codon:yes gene_type:complete